MPEIQPKIAFDAGIERIVSKAADGEPSLPESADVSSGAGVYKPQLDSLLFPPSIEQSLIASLEPNIANKALLTPTGFANALAQSLKHVSEGVVGESAVSLAPKSKEKLAKLAALFSEAEELRALLQTYRHLLHKA